MCKNVYYQSENAIIKQQTYHYWLKHMVELDEQRCSVDNQNGLQTHAPIDQYKTIHLINLQMLWLNLCIRKLLERVCSNMLYYTNTCFSVQIMPK